MKIVFHWLPGTRNSLTIARELAKCFEGTPLLPVVGNVRSPLLKRTMDNATPPRRKNALDVAV